MKKTLFCLLFLPLLYFCAIGGVPVCLENFTLLANVKPGYTIYMACSNGKFVDLGASQSEIDAHVFQPPVEVEESLRYHEELECNVYVEGPGAGELLGVVSLRRHEFRHHNTVGRLVENAFLVQFTVCPQEVYEQPATKSKMAPVHVETWISLTDETV